MKTSAESRKPANLSDFYILLFATFLLLCGVSSATPSITFSKKSGPPTSRILVSGRGFKPNVGVDIYFDTKDEALVVTNSKGVPQCRSLRPAERVFWPKLGNGSGAE
jgi:hypothetical protein